MPPNTDAVPSAPPMTSPTSSVGPGVLPSKVPPRTGGMPSAPPLEPMPSTSNVHEEVSPSQPPPAYEDALAADYKKE